MRQNNHNTKSPNKKITNWCQYEKALARRGDLFTILDTANKDGTFEIPSRTYERRVYNILCMDKLAQVFPPKKEPNLVK